MISGVDLRGIARAQPLVHTKLSIEKNVADAMIKLEWRGSMSELPLRGRENEILPRSVFMRNSTTSETSLFGLVGQFGEEIKTLIRQEVELAKVELSEKMTRLARNAILLAIGGVAAFAGLIILLAGLSSRRSRR